ncbi:hypothetical protein EAM_P208 (plasmid) [Erwinia amylovora ATCC 49946]|nr:hypothetical protein EAM_P208 [Erwinia amylovora ATCC 49946]
MAPPPPFWSLSQKKVNHVRGIAVTERCPFRMRCRVRTHSDQVIFRIREKRPIYPHPITDLLRSVFLDR